MFRGKDPPSSAVLGSSDLMLLIHDICPCEQQDRR